MSYLPPPEHSVHFRPAVERFFPFAESAGPANPQLYLFPRNALPCTTPLADSLLFWGRPKPRARGTLP